MKCKPSARRWGDRPSHKPFNLELRREKRFEVQARCRKVKRLIGPQALQPQAQTAKRFEVQAECEKVKRLAGPQALQPRAQKSEEV